MKRLILLKLLEEYFPGSNQEILFKTQMIDFINQYENCFERSLEVGHITASSWLLNKDGSKALLMHHSKLNIWVQLGGHCDGESDPLAVAIKEAKEESGIESIHFLNDKIFDIDIHLIPENKKEKEHFHYDVRFLLQVSSDELPKKNNESKELRWIGKNSNELPSNSESVLRLFNKWISLS